MNRCLPTVFVLLFFVISSCSDDDPASPRQQTPLAACSGPVTVVVGSGTTPTFSWSPACSLFLLLVEDNSGADQWSVITDSTNAIAPPVTYGVVPPGATGDFPPATLVSGTSYEVSVFKSTGRGKQDVELRGSKVFTPSIPAPDSFTVSTSNPLVYGLSWTVSDPTSVAFYNLYVKDPFTGSDTFIDSTVVDTFAVLILLPRPVFGVSSVSVGNVESALAYASAP